MTEKRFSYYGTRFTVERAKDFTDNGRMVDGNGYHLNLVRVHEMNGYQHDDFSGLGWFHTENMAMNYASELAARLKDDA